MRGITQEVEPTTSWLGAPTALALWTIGTGMLGGVASFVLSRRAEKEGWSKFKTGYIILGIVLVSAGNIWLATQIKGER